jgi:hypothetical protein
VLVKKINILGYNLFYLYYDDKSGWFRIFGKGLSFKLLSKHGLKFSERLDEKRYIEIHGWIIQSLK